MSGKRTCKGACKKFRVSKPTGRGRYESGQALCQICDTWIDYNGCHLKDGSSATEDSMGWFCNCCNYRVRRHPRNKAYKERLRAKQDVDTSKHQERPDMDRLNMLIEKTLHMIKSSQNGAYMNDLKMLLDISQEEMSAVATRLVRIEGMSKKEIHYHDTLQDVLFKYAKSKYPKKNTQDDTGQQIETGVSNQHDSVDSSQKERQHIYDQLWYSYNTSDLSRSLFMKYEQKVNDFDHSIDVVFQKKYIAFKINGKFFAGIIPQKSKLCCDLRLCKSDLDDPQGLLRDISNVGSWTHGKSSMNISDIDSLEYGINITRQCFDYVSENIIIDADKILDSIPRPIPYDVKKIIELSEQIVDKIRKGGKDLTEKYLRDEKKITALREQLTNQIHKMEKFMTEENPVEAKKCLMIAEQMIDEFHEWEGNSTKKDLTETEDIKILTEQMVNEHATNKKIIDKSLQRQLITEFVKSRSMSKVIIDNPERSEKDILCHVRTSLRFPEELKVMENEGQLHPNPECSLQIALFAVNYYLWDGNMEDAAKVTRLAQDMSRYIRTNAEIRTSFSNREYFSTKDNPPSIDKVKTHIAVWIAIATLHRDYGASHLFSTQDILSKIEEQNLCESNQSTINANVSVHCVANRPAMPNTHRKLYRVSRGRYRLYRSGDYCNPSRHNGQIVPPIEEIPDRYRDLVGWYNREYATDDPKPERDNPAEQSSHASNPVSNHTQIPKEDELFSEYELQKRFYVGNMGGIRSSTKNRIIVLINSYFSNVVVGYDNVIDYESDFITHVVQGSEDQTMTRNNKSVMMAKEYGYTLLYFNKQKSGRIKFICPVEYDSHSFDEQKNNEGRMRRVIMFKLKMIR